MKTIDSIIHKKILRNFGMDVILLTEPNTDALIFKLSNINDHIYDFYSITEFFM